MLHELGDGDVGPVALGPVHELGDQIPTLRPAEAPICSSGRSFPAAVHISFTNPAVVEMPASTKQPAPMSRAHFLPLQRGGGDLVGHYMEQQCREEPRSRWILTGSNPASTAPRTRSRGSSTNPGEPGLPSPTVLTVPTRTHTTKGYQIGYGEDQPITGNETEVSRRRNRWVDITIIPITREQS